MKTKKIFLLLFVICITFIVFTSSALADSQTFGYTINPTEDNGIGYSGLNYKRTETRNAKINVYTPTGGFPGLYYAVATEGRSRITDYYSKKFSILAYYYSGKGYPSNSYRIQFRTDYNSVYTGGDWQPW